MGKPTSEQLNGLIDAWKTFDGQCLKRTESQNYSNSLPTKEVTVAMADAVDALALALGTGSSELRDRLTAALRESQSYQRALREILAQA